LKVALLNLLSKSNRIRDLELWKEKLTFESRAYEWNNPGLRVGPSLSPAYFIHKPLGGDGGYFKSVCSAERKQLPLAN